MNLIAAAAILAALLTGPLPYAEVTSRDLGASNESARQQIAQNEQEVQPVPPQTQQTPENRIPAFWIILPD